MSRNTINDGTLPLHTQNMERVSQQSQLGITPEKYTRAIISLSKRYSSTSAFPGNNYVDLREWLLQDRALLAATKSEDDAVLFASISERPHDLVVVYNSGERRWDVQRYTQAQHDSFSNVSFPAGGAGQIVFIRGLVSPSWVSAIGSKYNIDPEFFLRHMSFLSTSVDRHAYSFPSLATSSDNIFRLCVSTVFHRDDFGGQDLRSQRLEEVAGLEKYKMQQLGSNRVSCGDSLVREYSTVCSSFSVLEQWISLCVAKTERGWSVIVWMDQGRPLEKSPPGPWTKHIQAKATPLPVLQHHHKMAFRTTTNRLDPEENSTAEIPQSAAVLPLQYDSLLALADLARRAPQDPMSMCIPLFAHSAFSEVQFLNLMESRIQVQMAVILEEVEDDLLGTLQYFSDLLNRHAQQLKDSARALRKLSEYNVRGRNETKPQGPEAETARHGGIGGSNGTYTAKGLLEDYEELRVRCNELSNMCSKGITLAINKAIIEESRKAIEQSQRLKRLTMLATLFIPLTFSTSLFGMNFNILGQGDVEFWWFFVLCTPITLLAYAFYLWDFGVIKKLLERLWKACRDARRGIMGLKPEKEAGFIV